MSSPARDELFQPTLQDPDRGTLGKPWNLTSLYYLAFFGGGLAAALLSFENARRLQMAPSRRWQILGLGFAFAGAVAIGAVLWLRAAETGAVGGSRNFRLIARAVSLGVAWLLVRSQRKADALYQVQSEADEAHGTMWGPGLLAAAIGIAIQLALVVAAFTLLP